LGRTGRDRVFTPGPVCPTAGGRTGRERVFTPGLVCPTIIVRVVLLCAFVFAGAFTD